MPEGKSRYLTMLLAEVEGYSPGLPDGVFFLEEESKTLSLGDELSSFLVRHGYKRVFPPIFEFYETYAKGGATDISRRSFAFKDKDGSLLALRYDMTTPIARMVSQRYADKDMPLRLFYYGDVFREQPFHQGKPRQIRQLGVELIGESTYHGDEEVIAIAAELLKTMDENYRLVLGDMRVYRCCLTALSLSSSQQEAIHRCFHLKDKPSLLTILDDVNGSSQAKNYLVTLMDMIGNLGDVCDLLKKVSSLGREASEVCDYFGYLKTHLSPEIQNRLLVDLGLVKDFGYYSSLMLEGYISQSGYPVCHGGRYDQLYRVFGKDFPAVGFALDLSYTFR